MTKIKEDELNNIKDKIKKFDDLLVKKDGQINKLNEEIITTNT